MCSPLVILSIHIGSKAVTLKLYSCQATIQLYCFSKVKLPTFSHAQIPVALVLHVCSAYTIDYN